MNLNDQKLTIFLTLIGSIAGAILVQHMRADLLRQMLPLLVIGIGLYFLLMPRLGEEDRQRRLGALLFGLVAGGCVGFYDGFFGPGAGSFYALAYVTLCGFNLAKSTAHAKVLNFTSNVGGLALFIIGGKVVWSIGLVMLVGQVLGARLGAHMVLTRGQKADSADDRDRLAGDEPQAAVRQSRPGNSAVVDRLGARLKMKRGVAYAPCLIGYNGLFIFVVIEFLCQTCRPVIVMNS